MLKISNNVSLDENEMTFEAIRAQGSGGQEGSVNRRLQSKKKHAGKKRLRGKVDTE